jgi:glycine hydroxymethyltransferase
MLDVIASRAVLFREAATPQFRAYQVQVLRNAKTLSDTLLAEGFRIVSGGTDTHLMLLDLTPTPVRGEAGQAILESVGIIVSKARIPFDESGGSPCGGLRLGTPAITTRGMKESGVRQIAGILKAVLRSSGDASVLKQARSEVTRLARALPLFSSEWDVPSEQGGAPGLEPRTLVADDASDASRLVGGEGLGYV